MSDAPRPRPRPRAPTPAPTPEQKRGSSALTAALTASLAVENGTPLSEVSSEALDELFDRINTHLAAGLPEAITDGELLQVVQKLRVERHRFQQEQEAGRRAPSKRAPRSATPPQVLDW